MYARLLQHPWIVRIVPVCILLLLGLLWGGVPSIAKYVIATGVHPLSYSFWILSIAASVLIIINFVSGRKLPPRRHIFFYVVCGVSGSALPTTIMYYAVSWIPAGLMAILIAVAPIFTYLSGMVVKVEKYHPLKTLGILLAFIGMLLILMPESVAQMKAPVWAILLGLLTPAFYAVNIVYAALRRPHSLHTLELSVAMIIAAATTMLFVNIFFAPFFELWNAEPLIALLILYHGVLTAIAFSLFYYLIKISGALFSSQVSYSATIFGILIGAYAHGEVLPLFVWLATVAMFAAIWFIQKARQLTEESQPSNR